MQKPVPDCSQQLYYVFIFFSFIEIKLTIKIIRNLKSTTESRNSPDVLKQANG